MIRIPFISFSVLLCLLAMTASLSSAHAQDATASLTEANKLMQQGLYVKAIEIIDGTLKSGALESKLAAKAMLMRAEANEKLGKLAFALADYNSAIWMEGLSPSDKAKAETGRKRITNGLGVAGSSSAGETKTAQTGSEQAPAANEGSGNPFSFITNLFSPSSASEGGAAAQQQQVAATQPAPAARPVVSPQQAPAAAPQRQARIEPQASAEPPAAASAANPTGDFAIQLAALRSEDDAISEVNRLSKRYKAELAGRLPKVTIFPTQDGGTLYKVVAEPFERGEGTATCELLKTKGTQCMLITK